MLDFLLSSKALMALLTLTFLEIILGIDNIVFISIAANKLPENQRLQFYARKHVHEWVQMAYSPQHYYFTINPASFKKGDKKHNR